MVLPSCHSVVRIQTWCWLDYFSTEPPMPPCCTHPGPPPLAYGMILTTGLLMSISHRVGMCGPLLSAYSIARQRETTSRASHFLSLGSTTRGGSRRTWRSARSWPSWARRPSPPGAHRRSRWIRTPMRASPRLRLGWRPTAARFEATRPDPPPSGAGLAPALALDTGSAPVGGGLGAPACRRHALVRPRAPRRRRATRLGS